MSKHFYLKNFKRNAIHRHKFKQIEIYIKVIQKNENKKNTTLSEKLQNLI